MRTSRLNPANMFANNTATAMIGTARTGTTRKKNGDINLANTSGAAN